jgi:hypothetical protein
MRGDLRRLRLADPLPVKSRFRTPRCRPKSRTAARGRSPSRRATGRIGSRHTLSLRFSPADSSRRKSAALLRCRQREDRHARSSRGRGVAFAFPLRGSDPQENHHVYADDCRYFREDGHAKRGAASSLAYRCVCKYMYYQSLVKWADPRGFPTRSGSLLPLSLYFSTLYNKRTRSPARLDSASFFSIAENYV